MSSRKISDLTPRMQFLYYKFEEAMVKAKLAFIVTCTARNIKEQIALYAQGRQPLEEVNALRKAAGLPLIKEDENKRKVTWTLMSKHIVNFDDNDPLNDKARAFDIALTKDRVPHWKMKVDINENQIPDYEEAGKIGESVGLVWGGKWGDACHYEEPKQ